MVFWKDKQGQELSFKQFMERWKQGIEGITPLQQTNVTIQGTYITIAGIILGIITSLLNIKLMWWVAIILVGAFIITGIQLIGLYQKKFMFMMMEGGNYEKESSN